MKKTILLYAGIIVGAIILIITMFTTTNNKAISLEEQINEAVASIEVQEKRRVDLIYNLVDTVKDYAKYESSTLEKVVEARSGKSETGDMEEVKFAINAIAEQYPDLKASENYKQLMTELAMTENLIAEHRNNYNMQVKAYQKHTRRFPADQILKVMGYEKIEFTYTEYDAPSNAPRDLFSDR